MAIRANRGMFGHDSLQVWMNNLQFPDINDFSVTNYWRSEHSCRIGYHIRDVPTDCKLLRALHGFGDDDDDDGIVGRGRDFLFFVSSIFTVRIWTKSSSIRNGRLVRRILIKLAVDGLILMQKSWVSRNREDLMLQILMSIVELRLEISNKRYPVDRDCVSIVHREPVFGRIQWHGYWWFINQ